MKKLLVFLCFIFCASSLFAQVTPFVSVPRGNANQLDDFRGATRGKKGFILPVVDTLNNALTDSLGALTVLPSDANKDTIPIWMSNGFKWIRFSGSNAININDTIYTEVPIAVKIDSLGRHIIYLLHPNGVVNPGYVIWTGIGLIFNITPALFYLNYLQYTSPTSTDTLAAAGSLTRSDLFIVDSTPRSTVLTGQEGGTIPQTNPSSQLPLTSIDVNPGDLVPSGVNLETIYNNHVAPPAEWLPTTLGSIAADFDNLANPYSIAPPKATYVSVYGDGSSLIFTKGSGTDTAQTGEILRGFIYFNVPFVNQLQFQWFNGSTAVSNSIAINAGYGINPNNITAYQIFAIPLNAWNFTPVSNSIFNKLVITMAGADSSGAGGFYLDYLQLQTGLLNIDQTPPPAWLVNGNSGTNTGVNFLGTLDPNPIRFKVNNIHSGWIGTANSLDMAMGYRTLPLSSVVFHDNTAFGANTLSNTNTLAFGNVAVGTYAGNFNTSGSNNVIVGVAGLFSNTIGYSNTVVGTNALYNNTIGHGNVSLGDSAGRGNTTGNYNIFFGYKAGITNTTTSNTLTISDSTYHMVYAIDTATGTAPSIIGYDPVTHRWGHYANTGGGGGGGLNIYNGDSSLSSDRTVDFNAHSLTFNLNTNFFDINDNGTDLVNVGNSQIELGNNTSINALLDLANSVFRVRDGSGNRLIEADVNNWAFGIGDIDNANNNTKIIINDDVSAKSIINNADIFKVTSASTDWVNIDATTFQEQFRVDGPATSYSLLDLHADGGADLGDGFNLSAHNDGSGNTVNILGDAIANTITQTSGNNIFNGTVTLNTVASGASTDSVLTIDAATGIVNMRDAASFGANETMQQMFDLENARAKLNKNDTVDLQTNDFHFIGSTGQFDALITNGALSSIVSVAGTQVVVSTQDNTGSSIVGSLITGSNIATLQTQESSTLMRLSTYKDSLVVANNNGTYFRIDEVDGGIRLPQYKTGDFDNTLPLYVLTMNSGGIITTTTPSGILINDQVTLVSGSKAITVSGVSTSSKAFVTLVTPSGVTLTTAYQAVCTANTVTLQANVAAGTINIADGSTLNYFVIK